jgi:hypothetical protein
MPSARSAFLTANSGAECFWRTRAIKELRAGSTVVGSLFRREVINRLKDSPKLVNFLVRFEVVGISRLGIS